MKRVPYRTLAAVATVAIAVSIAWATRPVAHHNNRIPGPGPMVWIAATDIRAGTSGIAIVRNNNNMLTGEDERLFRRQLPPSPIHNFSDIWGKVAAVAITKGTVLTESMFDVPSNPARVYVYVARVRIPRHTSGATMLQKNMVELKRLPYYLLEPEAVTSKSKLTNYVALHEIPRGTQVLKSELVFSATPRSSTSPSR